MCDTCSRRGIVGSLVALAGISTAKALFPITDAIAAENDIACGMDGSESEKILSTASSMPRKGDTTFHKYLVSEVIAISRVMNVDPGFQYIDVRNAFAIKRSIVNGTSGTVLVGVPLIRDLLESKDGGIAVAGTLAHECAHIFQFSTDYFSTLMKGQSTIRLVELHADYLAGYYIATRTGLQADKMSPFVQQLITMGTYIGGVRDHGTPGQRHVSMERGLLSAIAGKTFKEAAAEGEKYVRSI